MNLESVGEKISKLGHDPRGNIKNFSIDFTMAKSVNNSVWYSVENSVWRHIREIVFGAVLGLQDLIRREREQG
jgi:hypothetical protein